MLGLKKKRVEGCPPRGAGGAEPAPNFANGRNTGGMLIHSKSTSSRSCSSSISSSCSSRSSSSSSRRKVIRTWVEPGLNLGSKLDSNLG